MGATNSKQATTVTLDLHVNEDKEEQSGIEQWVKESTEIRLMVTGKTGTGKSTLLNGIVGEKMFKEGETLKPETLTVDSHQTRRAGVDIIVFDTPGLQDGSGNEQSYLSAIKEKCVDIHLLLYCISMLETRSDLNAHNSAIKLITKALGPTIWENAVIILTYANVFERRLSDQGKNKIEKKDCFQEKINEWEAAARDSLRDAGVPNEIAQNVTAIPVGFAKKPHLVCQKYWLSNFWTESLSKMKEKAQAAMVKMSNDRFRNEEDIKPDDFDKDISDQPIVFKMLDKAVAAGAASAGAIVGMTTGALIGALLIGIPTFGVAAGAGLCLGGLIGGGIGSGGDAGVGLLVALYRRNKKKTKMMKMKKENFEQRVKELGGTPASVE